jgi:hypothetical protein
MAAIYDLAALNRRAAEVRAQENELDKFFVGNVTQVTITDGENTLTVDVSKRIGMSVVHELMLAAIDKREKLELKMGGIGSVRVTEEGGQVA